LASLVMEAAGGITDQWSAATLIIRVATGLMIIAHGYNHIFGGGKIQGTAGWFASMGMRPGIVHAWLASITELACGVMLIVGLLTPLAAGGVLGVMVVAWVTAHRTNGFFIFKPGQGWEYVAYVSFTLAALGALGGGEWSLDDAFDIRFTGWDGLLVTLLVGLGGAATLLGGFWRPDRPAQEG
jgi:putative oxidoreductase